MKGDEVIAVFSSDVQCVRSVSSNCAHFVDMIEVNADDFVVLRAQRDGCGFIANAQEFENRLPMNLEFEKVCRCSCNDTIGTRGKTIMQEFPDRI